MNSLHDQDFYAWTEQQAKLLRAGRLHELDTGNLIEELIDMGASQERELEICLTVLVAHLLKWRYQPERQGKRWRATIKEQRYRIARLLARSPGLQSRIDEAFASAWVSAVFQAVRETTLDEDAFPPDCPFTLARVQDETFWP